MISKWQCQQKYNGIRAFLEHLKAAGVEGQRPGAKVDTIHKKYQVSSVYTEWKTESERELPNMLLAYKKRNPTSDHYVKKIIEILDELEFIDLQKDFLIITPDLEPESRKKLSERIDEREKDRITEQERTNKIEEAKAKEKSDDMYMLELKQNFESFKRFCKSAPGLRPIPLPEVLNRLKLAEAVPNVCIYCMLLDALTVEEDRDAFRASSHQMAKTIKNQQEFCNICEKLDDKQKDKLYDSLTDSRVLIFEAPGVGKSDVFTHLSEKNQLDLFKKLIQTKDSEPDTLLIKSFPDKTYSTLGSILSRLDSSAKNLTTIGAGKKAKEIREALKDSGNPAKDVNDEKSKLYQALNKHRYGFASINIKGALFSMKSKSLLEMEKAVKIDPPTKK